MVTITGGKLTTWRRMAKLAVDRLVERDGRDAPCRTHEIPLGLPVAAPTLPRVPRASPRTPTGRSPPATGRPPTTSWRSPPSAASSPSRCSPAIPDLLAEAVFAARHEQAQTSATCCCGAPASA